jgi:ABC-2 type transport system ATP-binding protein
LNIEHVLKSRVRFHVVLDVLSGGGCPFPTCCIQPCCTGLIVTPSDDYFYNNFFTHCFALRRHVMLEVSRLTRRYGDSVAVNEVGFTINQGEIVGLLGHNGAGKTTIMKMLSGYLEPDQGRVVMDSLDLALETRAVQRRIGYLPESLPVYPEMTVADYLDYAADLKGLEGDNKWAEIRRAIRSTDIADKLDAPIATLSRGYRQRVGVAQAILGKPRLLILDEPSNGLDPEQTRHMRELIRNVAREATVILSTHIMQEVDALCSRVLMMHAGRLVVDEQLETLRLSNCLLLECNLALPDLQSLVASDGVKQVNLLEQSGVVNRYRLLLGDGVSHQQASAILSRQVVAAGGELYGLQSERRDLETLFREVSDAA